MRARLAVNPERHILLKLNVIPDLQSDAGSGAYVPVVLTIGGIPSQPGVTLEVTAPPQ